MKKIAFLLFLTILSCKNSNKESGTKISKDTIEESKYLSINISAIIEEDDIFKLYYLKEGQSVISEDYMIRLDVFGSDIEQDLNFTLTEDILPIKLFLMFGNNEKKQKIHIKSGTVSYKEKDFSFEKDKFYQFFSPNPYVVYDKENAIATVKEVNGEFKPWFRAREVFINKMFFDLF